MQSIHGPARRACPSAPSKSTSDNHALVALLASQKARTRWLATPRSPPAFPPVASSPLRPPSPPADTPENQFAVAADNAFPHPYGPPRASLVVRDLRCFPHRRCPLTTASEASSHQTAYFRPLSIVHFSRGSPGIGSASFLGPRPQNCAGTSLTSATRRCGLSPSQKLAVAEISLPNRAASSPRMRSLLLQRAKQAPRCLARLTHSNAAKPPQTFLFTASCNA